MELIRKKKINKLKKFYIISGIVLFSLYISFGSILFIFQKDIIYYPTKQAFNQCPGFEDAQKLNLNGTRVYYKKSSENIIIFYHGNAGSACSRAYLKKEFETLGLSYAIVEYAGYSNDPQKPSINLLLKDVENVNEFIKTQNFSNITIAGESLGTSLAIYHSSIAVNDKLLLISPYYSLADIAEQSYGIYPISLLLTENYDNSKWLKNIKSSKVEILHGDQDELISLEQTQKVFNAIPVKDKRLFIIKGGNHNDVINLPQSQSAISNFLRE